MSNKPHAFCHRASVDDARAAICAFDDLFIDTLHVSSEDSSSDGNVDVDESVGIGVDENDKVCQAETSMAPAQVRKAIFDAVHDAQKIDESDVVEEVLTGGEDEEPGVHYTVTYSGKVHKVSGLETLEDCALDGDHTHVKCTCALGRNGQVCAPQNESNANGEQSLDVQGIQR